MSSANLVSESGQRGSCKATGSSVEGRREGGREGENKDCKSCDDE